VDLTNTASGPTWQTGILAGLALALFYTASPLLTLTLVASAVLLVRARRGLDPREQTILTLLLGTALALRLLYIAAVLIAGIPLLNDLGIGALSGDDAYYIGRAIRARDVALGITQSRYDFFITSDEYGRTSYLHLLTVLQVLFGPTPYGMRAVNALLYVTGAALLFRVLRPSFGATVSFSGLFVVLFLPSLFVSSVSLLKEPTYFLAMVLLLQATVTALRRPNRWKVAGSVAVALVCLVVLDDLRRGALVLALIGIATGVVLPVMFANRERSVAALASIGLILTIALMQPEVRGAAVRAVTTAAKTHGGHVFTIGHGYKLLDEGFYFNPSTPASWPLELTDGQALRFTIRAVVSFLVTPLPWEMRSLSELIFFPEHLVWLMMVILAPVGVIAAWQYDRRLTALLLGWIVPAAAALAVTTGNVGTLLRLRGLITPYLIWFAVMGGLAAAAWAVRPQSAPSRMLGHGR
jgi:hypothetical protein